MLNPERLSRYVAPGGDMAGQLGYITPAQYRRMKHKQFSRKTHQHIPGEICPRCRPGWWPTRRGANQYFSITDELSA